MGWLVIGILIAIGSGFLAFGARVEGAKVVFWVTIAFIVFFVVTKSITGPAPI